MQQEAASFRTYLANELMARCRENSKFSLRGFARTLAIEPSLLSKLLSGKRRLTPAMVSRLGERMGLSPSEVRKFRLSLVDGGEAVGGDAFRQLREDQFHLIHEWYHFPILELLNVSGFVFRERAIASALGISSLEASEAVQRLARLGFLERKDGLWALAVRQNSTLSVQPTSEQLRQQQKQILARAVAALEAVPIEKRDQSTMTMAIDLRRLPAAKEKIKTFRRELCRFLEGGSSRQEVYLMSISLFPVTQLQSKGTK